MLAAFAAYHPRHSDDVCRLHSCLRLSNLRRAFSSRWLPLSRKIIKQHEAASTAAAPAEVTQRYGEPASVGRVNDGGPW